MKFKCPNGHKLSAESANAGRRGICPKCQVKFIIPEAEASKRISESSILSVLGDLPADHGVVTKSLLNTSTNPRSNAAKKWKVCARCHGRMSIRCQICPECRLYQPSDFRLPA